MDIVNQNRNIVIVTSVIFVSEVSKQMTNKITFFFLCYYDNGVRAKEIVNRARFSKHVV